MKDACQFLRLTDDYGPVCMIGVNFYSVGKVREICRTCPLANLGDATVCENLDIFARQDWRSKGSPIQVEASCYFEGDVVSGDRCSNCPELEHLIITTPAEARRVVYSVLQPETL